MAPIAAGRSSSSDVTWLNSYYGWEWFLVSHSFLYLASGSTSDALYSDYKDNNYKDDKYKDIMTLCLSTKILWYLFKFSYFGMNEYRREKKKGGEGLKTASQGIQYLIVTLL